VPLTDLTQNLIDARALDLMRPGSFLVNTSRGPVANVGDIARALRTGHLAGFATDVPVIETHLDVPLQGLENVITTPHIGGYTLDALERVFKQAAENVLAVLSGENVWGGVGAKEPIL
jgi:phosphoglycerate dehydrogenase-like enzyme